MSPIVIEASKELQEFVRKQKGRSIGLVPTMGALHEGHRVLLTRARAENELSILTIFVNKAQFNDTEDFEKYPKTLIRDLEMAQEVGVDVVFAPSFSEMYPDNYIYQVTEKDFSKMLCGKDRPGHFDGVLTVVLKFFNLVKPRRAYFGEKDFQQLRLIQDMVNAFFLDVEIVPVPTVRENTGLAMSSRNQRLSEEERRQAPLLYRSLVYSKTSQESREKLEEAGFQVDYVLDHKGRRYGAIRIGTVRLIDNVQI